MRYLHRVIALLLITVIWVSSSRPRHSLATPSANASVRASAQSSRDDLIKNALAAVARIQEEIGRLRSLSFLRDVVAEYQSQEEFRKYVSAEVRVDLPREKGEGLARAAHHMGLLKEKIDLGRAIEDASVSQAGAYYDPQTKKFYIVMVPQSAMLLDTMSAHELTHALQDQHFDLTAYLGGRGNTQGLSEDALQARRFVVEGEATLTMMVHQALAITKINFLEPNMATQARMALGQAAGISVSQIVELQKQQSRMFIGMGDEIKKSIEAIDKIPPYILLPLFDAYFKGAVSVFEAYARGGWASVADLYKNPPDSTEQVLHPVEKLVEKRDYPVTLTLSPAGKTLEGWKEIHSDLLGELLWRVYFTIWGEANPEALAAGWDGDRYVAYAKGGKTLALIVTTWDTEEDATRFANAYEATLGTRFPSGPSVQENGYRGKTRTDGTVTVLEQQQNNVNIVDGGDRKLAQSLLMDLRNTGAKRHPKDQ